MKTISNIQDLLNFRNSFKIFLILIVFSIISFLGCSGDDQYVADFSAGQAVAEINGESFILEVELLEENFDGTSNTSDNFTCSFVKRNSIGNQIFKITISLDPYLEHEYEIDYINSNNECNPVLFFFTIHPSGDGGDGVHSLDTLSFNTLAISKISEEEISGNLKATFRTTSTPTNSENNLFVDNVVIDNVDFYIVR